MADELLNAMTELTELLCEIPGLRKAMLYPPEKINVFPALFISPSTGTWEPLAKEEAKGMHNIRVGCYVSRKDLPREVEKVLPYGELIKDKLLAAGNTTWTNTIDNIVGQIAYTFGIVEYAELTLIGWTIIIPIKIESVESSGVFSK